MIYRHIKASWTDDKKALYRLFLIDENMSLTEFAYILENMFRMEDAHIFRFQKGRRYWMPASWIEESSSAKELESADWEMFGNSFRFVYDLSEWWEFEIFVYKHYVQLNDERRVILENGNGRGIWEDSRSEWSHFLKYHELSADALRGGWTPYNMDDVDDLNETLYFDKQDDQERMNWFVEEELPDIIRHLSQPQPVPFDFWSLYNSCIRQFLAMNENDIHRAEAAETALSIFVRNCEILFDQCSLPEMYEELANAENAPEAPDQIFSTITDAMMAAGKYDELMNGIERIKAVFPDDIFLLGIADGICLECLAEQKRFEEAHELLNVWGSVMPDSNAIHGATAYILTKEGNLKDAKEILENCLKDDDPCTDLTAPLFHAAIALYEITDPDKAAYYREKLHAYENGVYDESEEDYGSWEINEELEFAVRRFLENTSQVRYSLATACFVMAAQEDTDVILALTGIEDPETTLPLLITLDQTDDYAAIYSTRRSAYENGYEYDTFFSILDIVDLALNHELSGIVVDPDENGQGLFIHASTLKEIRRMLKETDPSEHHALYLS